MYNKPILYPAEEGSTGKRYAKLLLVLSGGITSGVCLQNADDPIAFARPSICNARVYLLKALSQ